MAGGYACLCVARRQDHPYPRFYYSFYSILSLKLRQKENQNALIPLQSMERHFDPSHLTMGRIVQFTSNR
ncbi:MAG: hypothetical protein ABSE95_06940 [Thermodesulfobacteriota bacterium]